MDTLTANNVKASCCLQLLTTDAEGDSAGGYHFVSRFVRDGSFITFTYLGSIDKTPIDLKNFSITEKESVLDLINKLEQSGNYIVLSERLHINTIFTMQMMGRFDYIYNINTLENFSFDPLVLKDKEGVKEDEAKNKVVSFMDKRKNTNRTLETQESNDAE